MPERDYFDIPDDEPAAATPRPVSLPTTVAEPTPTEFAYPKQRRGGSFTIIVVIVFLAVIGGCVYLVWHQAKEQSKPKPPAASAKP